MILKTRESPKLTYSILARPAQPLAQRSPPLSLTVNQPEWRRAREGRARGAVRLKGRMKFCTDIQEVTNSGYGLVRFFAADFMAFF